MPTTTRTLVRRIVVGLAALAVLAGTFTLGVVAGSGSTPSQRPPTAPGVLDDAADEIAGNSLNPVDRQALDLAAMKAMLGAAGDQWGSWAQAASTSGADAGVGIWLRRTAGHLVVSQVATGGAASAAGARIGDRLLAVDGHPMAGVSAERATAMLRGRPGSTVTLLLQHGAATRRLTLTRTKVIERQVTTRMLSDGVGCIVVPAFHQGVGREVRDAVTRLGAQHATGIILDLRGDPGGLLAESVETASAFLDGGPVVTYTRRDERPQRLDAEGKGDTTTPLVVLVDGGTASAAEVVAGALQDRDRAVIVGARTFGKGSVQEPRRLPDGSSLALTVARYSLPSGRSVEGVGIEPDIDVASTSAGDAALARAREVLIGLRADTEGSGG